MIDYSNLFTSVKEIINTNEDVDGFDLSYLYYSFPLIESTEPDLLNICNEEIPAKSVILTGYYCNIDENYIGIYISLFNEFIKMGDVIKESVFNSIKASFINLIKMIDDNSYLELNESRPIYDLCDFVVEHNKMEIIANFVTNYTVPSAYEKDGNISVGKRNIGFRTYDINDILEKSNSVIDSSSSLNLVDKFGKGIPAVLISSTKDVDVYLTCFVGDWLAQLYKEDSIGLLSANVRSYLKRTNKVNREIIETVKDAPQEFVAYNNGLSAISTGIKYTGKDGFVTINELTGFLIVNGGQTTATLYECKNDKLDLSKITVPVKLAILKNANTSEYLVSNISIFSNSQTAIKKSDPPSNSKFYKMYEEISKKVLAKKNNIEYHCFFERTNGQYNTIKRMHPKKSDPFLSLNPEKNKFTKLQLAQAIVSWEQLPDVVCKGQEKNFEYFHSIVKDLNSKIVDETYFKSSYALIIIYRRLDQLIKNKKLPYKSNLIAYSMSFLSLKSKRKVDLLKIWENQGVYKELDNVLSEIIDIVYPALIDSPSDYPDIRMWARKTECWDKVKSKEFKHNIPCSNKEWDFLPENTAKVYIDNNLKNSKLWTNLEKWIHESKATFNEFQLNMIHGMPAVIYKDQKGMKKMTKKQENFAKSIFLLAVEQGYDFEQVG